MFLLDTNILSDARRDRTGVAARWLRATDPDALRISVITVGEIERGIAMRERTDRAGAGLLAAWLHGLRDGFHDRILPVDERVALQWGRIKALRSRSDGDALIAATARIHGLLLVTRNVRDFDDLDLPIVNPWAA